VPNRFRAHLLQHAPRVERELHAARGWQQEWLDVGLTARCAHRVLLCKVHWEHSDVDSELDLFLDFFIALSLNLRRFNPETVFSNVGLIVREYGVEVSSSSPLDALLVGLLVILFLQFDRFTGLFRISDELADVELPLADDIVRGDDIAIPSLDSQLRILGCKGLLDLELHAVVKGSIARRCLTPEMSIGYLLFVCCGWVAVVNPCFDVDVSHAEAVHDRNIFRVKDAKTNFKLLILLWSNVPNLALHTA